MRGMKLRNSVAAVPIIAISDKSRLLWERWYSPMQSAAAALNGAIQNTNNLIAKIILEAEGYSTDTHLFDIDRCVILPRPHGPQGVTNGKMDE